MFMTFNPSPLRAECPVHEALAVGRHRRERAVVRASGQLPKAGSVGIDDRNLRAAFGTIALLQKRPLNPL